jgi:hypothetical protein
MKVIYTDPNHENTSDENNGIRFLARNRINIRVMYGKGHCHDENSTSPATDTVLFEEFVSVNISKLGSKMLE